MPFSIPLDALIIMVSRCKLLSNFLYTDLWYCVGIAFTMKSIESKLILLKSCSRGWSG